jgi:hypothetical protein
VRALWSTDRARSRASCARRTRDPSWCGAR